MKIFFEGDSKYNVIIAFAAYRTQNGMFLGDKFVFYVAKILIHASKHKY